MCPVSHCVDGTSAYIASVLIVFIRLESSHDLVVRKRHFREVNHEFETTVFGIS